MRPLAEVPERAVPGPPRIARGLARARHLLAVAERVVHAKGPLAAGRAPRGRREPPSDRIGAVLALVGPAIGRRPRERHELEVHRIPAESAAHDHSGAGLALPAQDDQLLLVVEERDVVGHGPAWAVY